MSSVSLIHPTPNTMSKLFHTVILGYIMFLPVQFDFGGSFRLAPSDLFLMLALFTSGLQLRLDRRQFSSWHWGMLLIFVLASFVSIWRNGFITSYALLQKDFGFILLLLTYIMLVHTANTWEQLYKMLRIFLLSVFWLNLAALIVFFSGVQFSLMPMDGRLSGMLIDPNAYGGLLVTAFAIHIMTSGREIPLLRGWISLLATISLSGGILMTFSRSSWIGLSLVLLTLMVTNPSRLIKIGMSFLAAFGALLAYKGTAYLSVFESMASRPSQIESRLHIIEDAVEWIAQNPLLGIGLGTYNYELRIIIHNTPIWFLTEFGLFGLFIFGGFAVWFFVIGLRSYRAAEPVHRPVILALLLSHAAMLGLSMGIEALYQRHWWLFMAMNAACIMLTGKRKGEMNYR